MATVEMKPSWMTPRTILFACEVPVNEKAFEFALAQAREFRANLILFHACDTHAAASENSGMRFYEAATRMETHHLEPLAQRVLQAGVACELVVRAGLPAHEILTFAQEREIDRIVMGTHSPGPVGKLLVGGVAEVVLRCSCEPVFIVGPNVEIPEQREFGTRTVLCAVHMTESSGVVVKFATELAAKHEARLVLQHVIRPQDRAEVLAGRSLEDVEANLLAMVPVELEDKVEIQAIVVSGDPTQELLYQSRAQRADLIVLGAQGASTFAAITRCGVVYKTLAHAHCPVITLSPVMLTGCGAADVKAPAEGYMAGVI